MKNAIVIAGSLALAGLTAIVVAATQPGAAERMTEQQFISAALDASNTASDPAAKAFRENQSDATAQLTNRNQVDESTSPF